MAVLHRLRFALNSSSGARLQYSTVLCAHGKYRRLTASNSACSAGKRLSHNGTSCKPHLHRHRQVQLTSARQCVPRPISYKRRKLLRIGDSRDRRLQRVLWRLSASTAQALPRATQADAARTHCEMTRVEIGLSSAQRRLYRCMRYGSASSSCVHTGRIVQRTIS